MRDHGADRQARRQVRCGLCYHRFWPWEPTVRGANYFPHPWMKVHEFCAEDYLASENL